MPRQLPWLNKGTGGSRTQVKQPPKPAGKARAPSEINDDFFDGTVLASSSKGKVKTVLNGDDLDDDLPDLPAETSTPRTKSRSKDALHNSRAQSSSPPPIQDYIQPQTELMRKGASRFDLRDDEWMMVEDEFLETAKLFTRHMHIAEYEKLKKRIDAKKKEEIEAARPVVKGAGMSFEGKLKEKAKAQEKRQRKAIRDVFATQNEDDEDEASSWLDTSSMPAPTSSKQPLPQSLAHEPDSDDLDAQRPVQRTNYKAKPAPVPIPKPDRSVSSKATGQSSALRPHEAPARSTSNFAKPALPAPTIKPRTAASRRSRATPFDMLDDYVPPTKVLPNQHDLQSQSSAQRSSPSKPAVAYTDNKPAQSLDLNDDWGLKKYGSPGVSKGMQERLAKRKAEREKDTERKRKAVGLDDIPTFLY
jgi:hypothetical protein